MKFFTWCNIQNHHKLEVLNLSGKTYGIQIETLGQGIKWNRNYQKIGLLLRAIRVLDPEEIILCTDAFDVLYLSNEQQILKAFNKVGGESPKGNSGRIVFAAEPLYIHHYTN